MHRPAKEGQAGQGADGAVAVADDDDPPLLVNGQKVSKEQARLRSGLAATLTRCNLLVLLPPACMQVFWPKEGAHSTPDAPALIEEAPKAVWSPASHKLHFSDAGSFFSEVSIFHARLVLGRGMRPAEGSARAAPWPSGSLPGSLRARGHAHTPTLCGLATTYRFCSSTHVAASLDVPAGARTAARLAPPQETPSRGSGVDGPRRPSDRQQPAG